MHALANPGVFAVPPIGQSYGLSLSLCVGQIGPKFRLDLVD
ncbi:hypothetical protein J2793_006778 [Paraburkholderia caledonica]|uniref:Uncharacterized protein n=1 Tax=Paraburkholderia caledonica TaxID=134536 RepID=A0AB73IMR2_9BURK|nr:hypothetical protein [Paraburkholderia caledonica]